jgi:predicted glycosyltransferase
MNSHEIKAINQAIRLIGLVKEWRHNPAALDDAAVKLQIIMDCGSSGEAKELAATIVQAFDLWDKIEELRAEAAA